MSLVKLEVSYLWPVTISLLALATSSLLILGCWAGAWRLQLANNKRRMEYRWNTRFYGVSCYHMEHQSLS